MLELLSPAGSMEAVKAAVQNGADAIYMGYGDFNARRNAKNFTREEFAAAVSYCHLRGCKVYLTLNTLLGDRELAAAADCAADASDIGVDAILVQDIGVLRAVRQTAPDVPLHASTQMTVHDLDGVKRVADFGMTRAVLSRELSRDAIAYICERSPIEIEVFGHGALCMCYSGQCFFSSVIGGRSGNRGLCAQPCRLRYGWNGRADRYPLSLKDMSLAGHLRELRKMGVACLKIEGRMKRPEYVAVVTRIYADAIREGREPTPEEVRQLSDAFSRQGFTDGFYQDAVGPAMFGVREDQKEPKELFALARQTYEDREAQQVPITFYSLIRRGEPAQVGVKDDQENVVTVEGPIPEAARTKPLTPEGVEKQLSRTGGTPYLCTGVRSKIDDGLSLPAAALNALRREALEGLSARRQVPPVRRRGEFRPGVRYEDRREAPVLTVSVSRAAQITPELLALSPALVYVPLEELSAHPELAGKGPFAVALPRIVWDRERDRMMDQLRRVKDMGVTDALIDNWGMIAPAQELGFALRGGFGLEIFNSQAMKELRHMGFRSATASFELKLAQIRDLSKAVDTELIAYGRLPLMITENCLIRNRTDGLCRHACEREAQLLTDRKGARFPVVRAYGCRNEILNSKTLFLGDKQNDIRRSGVWAQQLRFTTESPAECVRAAERYLGLSDWEPREYTRGLYYRDVE
ncbi:U32 family peptidase [Pseudoflavonifractor sp. MSJ-37]|uniref:U32 family peptidase n=1 Tax=Pseudoflavonifractor sp. MSJ-37 TaxID=2841531 RepID=UPI001C0FF30F|nr:U32 family peptidase [Pseudoflavonifractor sp. MSJ-37]MBU5436061.1 U32 family peptidase [Pseudoflavonifractor sp. MSJ-37]